jgi:hypothetical protein
MMALTSGKPGVGSKFDGISVQRSAKGDTPYAIAKALGIDRHTAAKYAV